MLEVAELVAGYQDDIHILRGVTLEAHPGEVTVIIGANGVGKSTLLKTVFGFLRPWSGCIRLDGRDLIGIPPDAMARVGVGYIPQGHSVFPYMSVRENLELGCWAFRSDREEVRRRVRAVLARFPAIADHLGAAAGNLSGGLQRLVELARAMLTRPRVLLLDEPTVGLAPMAANFIYEEVARLARQDGLTVLLVDQNVRKALEVADRVYEMEMGRVKREMTGEEARKRIEVLVSEWLI